MHQNRILKGDVTAADLFEAMSAAAGEPVEPFVDDPWVHGGFRHIDLFAQYSRHAGRSIDVRESCVILGGKPLMVYGVPTCNVTPFVGWVENITFPLADGSFVVPRHFTPGSRDIADKMPPQMKGTLRDVLIGSHLILPQVVPADHPDALLARLRNRDLLASGRMWSNI